MVYYSVAVSPGETIAKLEAVTIIDTRLEKLGPRITEGHLLSRFLRACKVWSAEALYNKDMRKSLVKDRSTTRNHSSYQPFITSPSSTPTVEVAVAVAGIANGLFLYPKDQDWNDW